MIIGSLLFPALSQAALYPKPHQITQARKYTDQRKHGQISWAVVDSQGNIRAYRGNRTYRTASVIKAMILAERLRQHRNRPLSAKVKSDLSMMIRYSDNLATSRQYQYICAARIRKLAKIVGMKNFSAPNNCHWGKVRFSAIDQAKLFYEIDKLMPERHRAWGMRQLRTITASQQWGIAAANRNGWRLAFKGGWLGQSCGQIEHQVGLFSHPHRGRWSLAILSECNPSSAHGRKAQYEIARQLT